MSTPKRGSASSISHKLFVLRAKPVESTASPTTRSRVQTLLSTNPYYPRVFVQSCLRTASPASRVTTRVRLSMRRRAPYLQERSSVVCERVYRKRGLSLIVQQPHGIPALRASVRASMRVMRLAAARCTHPEERLVTCRLGIHVQAPARRVARHVHFSPGCRLVTGAGCYARARDKVRTRRRRRTSARCWSRLRRWVTTPTRVRHPWDSALPVRERSRTGHSTCSLLAGMPPRDWRRLLRPRAGQGSHATPPPHLSKDMVTVAPTGDHHNAGTAPLGFRTTGEGAESTRADTCTNRLCCAPLVTSAQVHPRNSANESIGPHTQ